MKVALIGDTHWGIRNDSVHFMDMSKRFLDNVFFPTIKDMGIKTIIHLGDLVDRRKYINIQTANRLRYDFIYPILEMDLDFHIILGNHDVYYKNTNSVNAIEELYASCNINVWHKATDVNVHGTKILFVPWICAENRDHSLNSIANSHSSICMGHLELQGFEMYKGSINTHGDSPKLFEKFDLTLSGHYHHRSSDGSIHYLGSHGQFTWSDYDDGRGFHVLDLESRVLEFVENPYRMFSKIFYDDTQKTIDDVLNVDFEAYKNTFVKVVVKNKLNAYWFDMFCDKLDKIGLLDMQIVEDHLNLNLEEDSDIVDEAESTLDIFKKHIGYITSHNINKIKLERTIVDLYSRAMTLDLASK